MGDESVTQEIAGTAVGMERNRPEVNGAEGKAGKAATKGNDAKAWTQKERKKGLGMGNGG
jgi:hypothetical protein